MNDRDYWVAWAYWAGRELRLGWDVHSVPVPDRYLHDAKIAYLRGVFDFSIDAEEAR